MMSEKNKVVVIVVSYNGMKYWPDLMPALSAEKYNDFDLEILVVDNNSSDNSVAYLKQNFEKIKIIENRENTGFVGANNIGYEYAKKEGADFIYLLNQDTEIELGFLEPLYNFARANKNVGSLQSKLMLHPETSKINTAGNAIHFLGFGYGQKSNQLDDGNTKIQKINYCSGAGVFVSMDALEKLGGLFDETMFMYLEDLDLGWSLNMLGYDNYLVPQSIIYHKYEFDRSMRQYTWFERNRLWAMLKNYKLGTWILIFPAFLLMELAQILYAFLNGRLVQKFRAYGFLFSKVQREVLSVKRSQIQSKRTRGDRRVSRDFKGRILFQPLDTIFLKIANVFFGAYWQIIKIFIFW